MGAVRTAYTPPEAGSRIRVDANAPTERKEGKGDMPDKDKENITQDNQLEEISAKMEEMSLKLEAALENNAELKKQLEEKDKDLKETKKLNFKLAEGFNAQPKKTFSENLMGLMKGVR